MSLEFDLTSKRVKNLNVLKSINSNVFEIIEDSSHVALYKFDTASSRWDRVDVEGSAFITRNIEAPFYSLIIMNKKGPSDFVLDLKSTLRVKVQDVYIMIRCTNESAPIIFGLWFHNEEERTNIFMALKRITTSGGENGSIKLSFALSNLLQSSSGKNKSQSESNGNDKNGSGKMSYSDVLNNIATPHSNGTHSNGSNGHYGSIEGIDIISSPTIHSQNGHITSSIQNQSAASNSSSAVKRNLLLSALNKPQQQVSSVSELSIALSNASTVSDNNSSSVVSDSGNMNSSVSNDRGNALLKSLSVGAVSTSSQFSTAPTTACVPHISSLTTENTNGSARLLNLLKASSRDVKISHDDKNIEKNIVMTSSIAPSTTIPPHNTSTTTADEERSNKLLSMLRHGTTSINAMDLLTDGDIARKQTTKVVNNNSNSSANSSVVNGHVVSTSPLPFTTTDVFTSPVAAEQSVPVVSSGTKLLNMLKSQSSDSGSVTAVSGSNGNGGSIVSVGDTPHSTPFQTPDSSTKSNISSVNINNNSNKNNNSSNNSFNNVLINSHTNNINNVHGHVNMSTIQAVSRNNNTNNTINSFLNNNTGSSNNNNSNSAKENQLLAMLTNGASNNTNDNNGNNTVSNTITKPIVRRSPQSSPALKGLSGPITSTFQANKSPELRAMNSSTHSTQSNNSSSNGNSSSAVKNVTNGSAVVKQSVVLLSPSDLLRM